MKATVCDEFVQRLDALLGGEIDADERKRLEAHADQCPRCGTLLASMRHPAAFDLEDTDSFLSGVMQRTSGSACQRAEMLLPAWLDELLAGEDAELLSMHLGHCGSCAALASVLHALRRDLSSLAFVDPGAAFTEDVVAATKALRQRPPTLEQRLAAFLQRLLARPRFAWEFATAASFVLVLLCGMPFSPLRPLPRHALAAVQVDPVVLLRGMATELEPTLDDLVATTWEHSGVRLKRTASNRAALFAQEHAEMATTWRQLRTDLTEVGTGFRQRNLAQMSHALRQVQMDLHQLFTRPSEAEEGSTESS